MREVEDYFVKELECEHFKVMRLGQISPSKRYLLMIKDKTDENLFQKETFIVYHTPQDISNGVTAKEIIDRKKLELLSQIK